MIYAGDLTIITRRLDLWCHLHCTQTATPCPTGIARSCWDFRGIPRNEGLSIRCGELAILIKDALEKGHLLLVSLAYEWFYDRSDKPRCHVPLSSDTQSSDRPFSQIVQLGLHDSSHKSSHSTLVPRVFLET